MVRNLLILTAVLLGPGADRVPAAPPAVRGIAPLPDFGPRDLETGDLETGDLVLRIGTGWRADAVRVASGYRFTHVGIVTERRDGLWRIVHAAPPEGRDAGGVREESLAGFLASGTARGVAFWRAPALDGASRDRLLAAVRSLAAGRAAFDDDFDLADARALYCTELIWRAFAAAGLPFPARTTRIAAGPLSGDYMLPQDLLVAGRFTPIRSTE